MIKKLLLISLLFLFSSRILGQQFILTGKVTDVTGEGVPFSSVYVKGTSQGTSANVKGVYQLRLKPGKYLINYRAVGYKAQSESIDIGGQSQQHNVQLHIEKYDLSTPTSGEDPAINIIKNAIAKRQVYLNELNAYSCNVYIRGTQRLLHAPKSLFNIAVAKKLEIDTNRSTILYLSELESRFNFEQPNKVKEVMTSSKAAGSNNAFNFNRAADLQVNFYKNIFDIEGLNPRGFISPIADNALEYYHYKLLGTATENGKLIDKIEVIPIRDHDPVFHGNIYIIDGDWRIYNAHLFVTKQAGLNFVDTLNINQQYIPITDDKWQPASVSFTYNGSVLGFKYDGYILGVFSDYDLAPKFPAHYFNGEIVRVTDQTLKRDSAYWKQNRPVSLTADELKNYNKRDSILKRRETPQYLDSLEHADNKFSPIQYVFLGDTIKHRANQSSWYFHPLYETVFFNTVEGLGLDLKADYNKQLSFGKNYTISPEVRYGFSDNLLNANTAFTYQYDAFNKGVFYGRIGTNVLDLNSEASVSTFTNTLSTLVFKDNILKVYRSKFAQLGLQRNVARGLLLDGSLEYAKRNALLNTTYFKLRDISDEEFTSNNPLKPDLPETGLLFTENNALTLKLAATYTFDEEYTTTPNGVTYDPDKYPKIKLSYRKGIKNLLGSNVDYDYADVQIFQDHIKTGLFGYSAFVVIAGTFLNNNALIYPDYKQFKGNQGITFTPTIGSFHFLPYYTYSSGSFLEAHYEHNFSGFIFNKVPGLRALKLEEIVGVNYLSQQNNPGYSEFYFGIQRFFFRLDYGLAYMGSGRVNQGFVFYYGF